MLSHPTHAASDDADRGRFVRACRSSSARRSRWTRAASPPLPNGSPARRSPPRPTRRACWAARQLLGVPARVRWRTARRHRRLRPQVGRPGDRQRAPRALEPRALRDHHPAVRAAAGVARMPAGRVARRGGTRPGEAARLHSTTRGNPGRPYRRRRRAKKASSRWTARRQGRRQRRRRRNRGPRVRGGSAQIRVSARNVGRRDEKLFRKHKRSKRTPRTPRAEAALHAGVSVRRARRVTAKGGARRGRRGARASRARRRRKRRGRRGRLYRRRTGRALKKKKAKK